MWADGACLSGSHAISPFPPMGVVACLTQCWRAVKLTLSQFHPLPSVHPNNIPQEQLSYHSLELPPTARHARCLNTCREDLTISEMGCWGLVVLFPHPPGAYLCLFASTEDLGLREVSNLTVAIKPGFTASEPHLADVCRYPRINDVTSGRWV
jgi:hypothetical protein